MNSFDCIVVGAGAAGLMCALTAGQRGRSVGVLEHANKVGKKILMSGGGRCNFTNLFAEPENFICANPHFCKSALSRYTQYDFIDMVERHGIAYHEKTLGQLFCDNKSRDILNMLLAECDRAGVEIHTHCAVEAIARRAGGGFELATARGPMSCESLVIATGGLSIPRMGASGFGYDVARQFGLKILARHAALVPFTFKGEQLERAQTLAGVALPVEVTCRDASFREALLFTHKGISGPAILQISNYWHPGDKVVINFAPDHDLEKALVQARSDGRGGELRTFLAQHLPKALVTQWLESVADNVDGQRRLAELSNAQIKRVKDVFNRWTIVPAGTEGYATAEVTRGGIDTDEISSKTFEAHNVPGLYFIGEVLDVTGWLGGYNFQWAWASGYCAGQVV